jgi:ribosomal protein S18 acetylase RimI-like enzyme
MDIHKIGNNLDFLLWRQGSGKTVEIFDIQVGSIRRQGIGKTMVFDLLLHAPVDTTLVWAITRSTNLIAQEFYEALGFRVVGILRDFYQDQGFQCCTVDAIMYGRKP